MLFFSPQHRKDSVPFSQFIRLRRMCSDDANLALQLTRMTIFFDTRGNPSGHLRKALTCVSSDTHLETLFPQPRKETRHRLTNTRILPCLAALSKRLISSSPYLRTSLLISKPPYPQRPEPVLGPPPSPYLLPYSSHPPNLPPGTSGSDAIRCLTCQQVSIPNSIILRTPKSMTCKSDNIAHAMFYLIYILEPERCLHDRFREHRPLVNRALSGSLPPSLSTHVFTHFSSSGQSEGELKLVCFERVSETYTRGKEIRTDY